MNKYSKIFEYDGYYQDFLEEEGVSLQDHHELIGPYKLDLDYEAFLKFFTDEEHRTYQTKYYEPRPFYPRLDMIQAVCLMHLGYNEHNSSEISIGHSPLDNDGLRNLIGNDNFDKIKMDPDTCLIRMLQYNPGNGIPLHTDSYNGFQAMYGKPQAGKRIARFACLLKPWDWGQFLQIHDNMIHHWDVGDTYEIPAGVYHTSANFGISKKYTLTLTGFVDE